jgi:hypothetical protein
MLVIPRRALVSFVMMVVMMTSFELLECIAELARDYILRSGE